MIQNACGVCILVVSVQSRVVKTLGKGGLDDLKIGRDVEVAWREQAVVANTQDLFDTGRAIRSFCGSLFDDRQDGVVDGLERLSDQGRANRACGIAAAELDETSAPTQRNRRRRQQVASQIEDIAQIVAMPQTLKNMQDQLLPILFP